MRSGRSLKKLAEIQDMRDMLADKVETELDKVPIDIKQDLRIILLRDKVGLLDWVLCYATT